RRRLNVGVAGHSQLFMCLTDELRRSHSVSPLFGRLQMDDWFVHIYRSWVGRGISSASFSHARFHFWKGLQNLILLTENSESFVYRNGWIGYRHIHDIALIERRHELLADSRCQDDRAGE